MCKLSCFKKVFLKVRFQFLIAIKEKKVKCATLRLTADPLKIDCKTLKIGNILDSLIFTLMLVSISLIIKSNHVFNRHATNCFKKVPDFLEKA